MPRILALVVAALALVVSSEATNRTVVITGATGQSGSYTYLLLKQQGVNVRGVVRDVAKARKYLGCSKCDESEGIFVGDIKNQESLVAAMTGAHSLIITTGAAKGEKPGDILEAGVKNQVDAFLGSPGPATEDRHVMHMSMMYTTLVDSWYNKLVAMFWGGWDVGFYSLQGEVAVMDSNVPFTIIKCCGLDNSPAKVKKTLVGHYDTGMGLTPGSTTLSRHDVARVFAFAAQNPKIAANLRFDFCSAKSGSPVNDEIDILKDSMFPWDPRKKSVTPLSLGLGLRAAELLV